MEKQTARPGRQGLHTPFRPACRYSVFVKMRMGTTTERRQGVVKRRFFVSLWFFTVLLANTGRSAIDSNASGSFSSGQVNLICLMRKVPWDRCG